jgi:hypothetical protein
MLAMTLNSMAVQPDALPAGPPSRLMRIVQKIAERRGGGVERKDP